MDSITTLELAKKIREDSLRMVYAAKASHIGGVYSSADILAVLYGHVMKINPDNPVWAARDRFILSKGHCCAGLYAALANVGFFSRDELSDYAKFGSKFMSHVSHKVPGVEFSTGSLGHGLPFAVGKAFALKQTSQRVFCLLSDGELNEGSNWEAIMSAAHFGLANLTIIIDKNGLQSLDTTQKTLNLDPLKQKLASFELNVVQVHGHNHSELTAALTAVDECKPTILICDTIKGYPISFMENKVEWHYKSPNSAELRLAQKELDKYYAAKIYK